MLIKFLCDQKQSLRGNPDIAIVLVGEGNAKKYLQDMATKENLRNVYFFPLQSRDEVPDIFGMADVSIVSLRREIAMEAVPSKTYSIMASGRPVIATVRDDTEVAQLIQNAKCGIRVEPEDPKALADAIQRLYEDSSLKNTMGSNGRKFVVDNYSRQVATRKYRALIESLTQ